MEDGGQRAEGETTKHTEHTKGRINHGRTGSVGMQRLAALILNTEIAENTER